MSASVVRGDALRIPLRDASVDLIVTSPPYFSQRSYRDGGEHYAGQMGSEPTPQAFLEALWEVTKECWRVLKPTGSMFVNLGDKRSGSGGHNNAGVMGGPSKLKSPGRIDALHAIAKANRATRRNAPDRYNQAAFGRPKSKMLLPHRYAIGCEDGLADPEGIGWIVRQDIVWNKPNGLPESVTDRTRDSHEMWFHLTKQGRYFSAVDEVREPQMHPNGTQVAGQSIRARSLLPGAHALNHQYDAPNPLGKLPGSVWQIASEPLVIPEAVKAHYGLPDHFAAFAQEWPRRLILGWSPSGVCTACGEGRRPVVAKELEVLGVSNMSRSGRISLNDDSGTRDNGYQGPRKTEGRTEATITGYACACPEPTAPTTPSVVLDPFGGTGTTAGVARALGRTGVNLDLSMDYCRLAQWFLKDGKRFGKAVSRTERERQGDLFADPFRSAVDVPTGTTP